ncbi:hypothetical protein BO71DRAFT_396923 [Aspergillus ellipticus CBS 707.79]|uniref:BZIP domain-containing protein n=1 Tax=Aspergillus ellipticus CBS 707.79 TaxID=1448320 RepID=A0A319DHX5_9EURO|nr:hypothetical protein BO71DRAFT_396923 [Aspergillus ellipticus CBS 707.79]
MSNAAEPLPDDPAGTGSGLPRRSRDMARAERRRHQNRINQQAWSKYTYRGLPLPLPIPYHFSCLPGPGQRQRARREEEHQAQRQRQQHDQVSLIQYPIPDLSLLVESAQDAFGRSETGTRACRLTHPNVSQILAIFEAAAYQSYRGNPRADHRLTLVKLNVFRAFIRNVAALGYDRGPMTDDSISRFSVSGPHPQDLPGVAATTLPASLCPTELQRSRPHHPWLDFFPFAQLRDNLIRHEDCMDDIQLCRDLMGFWTMPEEDNCMLVWGDPWEPTSWEVTETFLRKWGRLVRGCPEIIWSTNYWREVRGEKRLTWKASYDRLVEIESESWWGMCICRCRGMDF